MTCTVFTASIKTVDVCDAEPRLVFTSKLPGYVLCVFASVPRPESCLTSQTSLTWEVTLNKHRLTWTGNLREAPSSPTSIKAPLGLRRFPQRGCSSREREGKTRVISEETGDL